MREREREELILYFKGWRPGRTVVLCSWDAEEYGLIGSTEYVEVYIYTNSYIIYYLYYIYRM